MLNHMKWQIRTYYKKDLTNSYLGQIRAIRDNIRSFLGDRDFKIIYQSEIITDSNGNKYNFSFDYQESTLEVTIETENWKSFTQVKSPQIVLLVEDYFKSNTQFWYYLETLTKAEIEDLKVLGRAFEPLNIKQRLESIEINQNILKPILEKEGDYQHQQTDLYSGTKRDYGDVIGFWISFLSWVWNADIEFNDLNYFLEKGWFDTFHGSCIPKKTIELEREIKLVKDNINWFSEDKVKRIYLMRKDWNDCIYLFDLGDSFIIYNWWTSE